MAGVGNNIPAEGAGSPSGPLWELIPGATGPPPPIRQTAPLQVSPDGPSAFPREPDTYVAQSLGINPGPFNPD